MSGPGLGPYFQNLSAQVDAKGGYQAMAQEYYEAYSTELDNFLSGGAQRRIFYEQSRTLRLVYKLVYLLLFSGRLCAGIWSLAQDSYLNQEHWFGILSLLTMISALLLLFPLLFQLTAAPRMTPNRFKNASTKLRQLALLDAILLLLFGGITIILCIVADHAPATVTTAFFCGLAVLFASLCSFILFLLEHRRKCRIIEPDGERYEEAPV